MKKFKAKSVVALTAAMAIVTVGGVYAAWYYTSTSGASGVSSSLSMNVEAGSNNSVQGTYTYDITYGNSSNQRVYHIDQYTEAQNNTYYNGNYKIGTTYNGDTDAPTTADNHTAALCVDENTTFTVYFQAGSGADTDAWYYGVTTTITLTMTTGYYLNSGSDWNYNTSYDASNYPYAMFGVNSSCSLGTYDDSGSTPTLTITINPVGTSSGNVWTADSSTAGLFYYTFDSDALLSLVSLDYMVVPDYTTYGTFNSVGSGSTLDFAIAEVT